MPIIYTYPSATPTTNDLLLISDTSETDPENATRKCTVGDIVSLVGALVPGGGTVTSLTVSDGTYVNFTATPDPITTTGSITADLNAVDGTSDVTTRFLSKDNTWDVPTYTTDTTYTAGDGLDLTGTVFSTDLRSNGGLVINTTELQVDLAATDMAGTLRVVDGGTELSTITANSIMTGNGTNPIQLIGPLTNGQLLVGSTGAAPVAATLTGGTNITITNGAGAITIDATATGTMSQFNLAGSAGTPQVINNSDTVTIEAGSNISTTAAATDKVTVAWVAPQKTNYDGTLALRGSGGGTVAAGAFTTNLAAYYEIGDFMYIQYYLVWTSAAGAGITGNLILTALPKAAYQTGAAIDNGNCLIHANDNLGIAAGDSPTQAPTTGWVAKSGVATEMTYRYADHKAHIFADYPYTNRTSEGSPSYTLAGTITYMVNIHE